MQKHSFSNYKRTLSVVLCLTYIFQFPSFGIAHYFLMPSTNNEWAFLIGFWGINILLMFLVDFFHTGMPKSLWDSFSILIFLVMSSGYFFTLYYCIYWLTIVLTVFITIITFALRYVWTHKFNYKYCENTKYLKEESIIRLSMYILPTIFLSVICSHIENVIPHSFFSIFVRFVYFIIAFSLIAITYLTWYNNMEKTIPYNQLTLEIIWLLTSFSVFVIGIEYFKNSVLTFLFPILGIIPILLRHKKT